MTVDPEILDIRQAMTDGGHTQADLGRLLGLDSSQVTRIFQGKRKLQLHEARRVREWLGLAERSAPAGQVVPGPGMVPLYGWVGAASEGRHVLAEQVLLGHIPRHPNQANLREAFALQVSDVSMSPRYEPGEIVYVAPNQWPARAQDCVVVTTEGYAYLKRFLDIDDVQVRVEQLNPQKKLGFPRPDVQALHAVVGRG
ncbi:MAG TPA: XRE family transcriptional regulator [Stellaceae bacterium]|nr:XRE family transcriptional regulator [Stellaceae bacterium]